MADGAVWLEDLASSAGTFVNDVRISARVALKSGDRVRFGPEEFEVSLSAFDAQSEASGAVSSAKAPRIPQPLQPIVPVVAAVIVPVTGAAPISVVASVVVPVGGAPPAVVSPAVEATVRPAVVARAESPKAAPFVDAGFPVADGGAKKRPGAWAVSLSGRRRQAAGDSTKYLDPSDIREMITGKVQAPAVLASEMRDPHLQIISGTRAGVNLRLGGGPVRMTEWTIGSDPQRDVLLPDEGVSAFHARIMNEGQRWKVVDQMSANGTFVNGKRSTVSYVSGGDRMVFGRVECIFQAQASGSFRNLEAVSGRSPRRWLFWTIALGVLGLLALGYKMLRAHGS